MTKDIYLKELSRRLNLLNIEGKEEILIDFKNHFELGHQDGISDEDLIASLGTIDEILAAYDDFSKTNNENILVHGHTHKKEYTNTITTVDISARHADTKISTSEDGGFHVDLFKEGKLLERLSHTLIAYQEEAVFFIKVLPLFPHKSNGQYDLTIQVPRDLPCLKLNTSSGDVSAKHLSIKTIKLSSANGDLNLNDIQSESISIDVASADVKLNEVNGDLDIRCASGTVKVDTSNGAQLTLKNASGDFSLKGDYQHIKLSNASGDLDLQLKTIQLMHASNISGNIKMRIKNQNDLKITAHGVNGEYAVYKANEEVHVDRHGSYQIGEPNCEITLNTVSGDIRLDLE